jgi:hypothetical protein
MEQMSDEEIRNKIRQLEAQLGIPATGRLRPSV